MKLGIIMALPQESQGLFEKQKAPVHYCGVGKVNAAYSTVEIIRKHHYDLILNLGTAGSHKFPIQTLVECISYVQRDMDLSLLGLKRGITPMDNIPGKIEGSRISELPNFGICGTSDTIELGPPLVECDLVDMEAFAIAKVCKKMNIQFHAIKYITDSSNKNTHKDWTQNLKLASKALFDLYLNHFKVDRVLN
jgi:adenosylhomocysteine nucleosidase